MPTIPPPWEEVESQFREVEPGGDMNQWRRRYNAMRDLALQRAANQGTSEGVGEFLSRRSIPFASAAYGAADTALVQGARQRIAEGNHSHQDILDVADYENRNREQGIGMTAVSGLAHIPAIVGEALAGGAAVRGLGLGATAAQTAAAAERGFAANALRSVVTPMSWFRNAAQTAAMPSMWLPEWTERNVQAGRNAFDPRALPSSYAMGFLNTAVLGSLSSPVGGAISGPGVYRSAARILATTGAGVLEQQGVDAFASAVSTVLPDVYKLNTGYGMVGSILRGAKTGQWDEALKVGVSQLVTFGAFSVLHGASPKHVVGDIKAELDGLHESGATPRVAGEELIQRYNPEAIAQRAAPAPPVQEPGIGPQFQPRQPFQAPEQMPPQGPQPGMEPSVPDRPPSQVQRILEPGEKLTFDKPQGIYTSPADVESPHAGIGGPRRVWNVNDQANVLTIRETNDPSVIVRKDAINAGTGVWALRELVGEKEFARLKSLSKKELESYIRSLSPNLSSEFKPFDKQDALEALGGVTARQRGYDAIFSQYPNNRRFDEFVALTPNAFIQGRPIPPSEPGTQRPPAFTGTTPEQQRILGQTHGEPTGDLLHPEHANEIFGAALGNAPEAPVATPEAQQAQLPAQGVPEAPVGQPARPEPMPSAEHITVDDAMKMVNYETTRQLAVSMGIKASGAGVTKRYILEKILARPDGQERLQNYAKTQERGVNLGHLGTEPLPDEFVQPLEQGQFGPLERESLESVLTGQGLRPAGKALGISHEEVNNRAKDAFRKLKEQFPQQFGDFIDLPDYKASRALKLAESIPDAAHEPSMGGGAVAGEHEADFIQAALDKVTEAEAEHQFILENDYGSVEHHNVGRNLIDAGRAAGVTPQGVRRLAERIRQKVLQSRSIEEAKGTPQEAAGPATEGVNAPVRGTEHMTNAELDAAISRHYNKGGEDHLAEILMNEKQRRLGLGEIDPDTGNPVVFPEYPPGVAKLAEAGITPGREEQAPSIKRFMSFGSLPYEQAHTQSVQQQVQQAAVHETAAQMPQTPSMGQRALEWTQRKTNALVDWWKEVGNSVFPRTARVDQETGNKMAQLMASGEQAHRGSDWYRDAIGLNEMPTEDVNRFGAAWNELRLRMKKESLATKEKAAWQEAQNAKARIDALASLLVTTRDQTEKRSISTEMKRLGKLRQDKLAESAAASNAGRDVISMIGRKDPRDGSIRLADEAAFQQTLSDPRFQELHRRWEGTGFSSYADELFNRARGLNEEIHSDTQIPGFSGSMIRVGPEEMGPSSGGAKQGSTKNQQAKTPGALRSMTGAGEYYETDLGKILDNTLSARMRAANIADLYRTAHANGAAVIGDPGQRLAGMREIGGADITPGKAKTLNLPEGKSLYVPEETYGEWKSVLRLNDPFPKLPGANILNTATLMSLQEATSHGINQATSLMEPRAIRYVFQTLPKLFSAEGKTELKKQLFELAKIGATKPAGFETGAALDSPWNPMKWTSKLLDMGDTVMRVSLNQAFESMVRSGDVPDTPQNRRDFINQNMGNYNKDGQNRVVQFARESGLGPFATATTTYTVKGVKNLVASPNVTATSTSSALKLRAEKLGKMAAVLGAAFGVNAMFWGNPLGDDKTPVGAVKVGEDAQGNSMYVDLAALTGLRRGARLVGLNALMEGSRYGAGAGDIATKGATDFFRGVSAPFQGPIREFANVAMTGEDMRGTRVAPQSERGDWNSQALINIRTALIHANPIGEQIIPTIAGLDEVHPPSTTERIVTPLTGGLVKFRDQPQGQPSRPYLARSAEIDRLNDTISNLNAAKKKVEQNGDIFEHEAELRVLSQFSRQINQLEDVVRGGRIQRRLRPELRDARDREFEQIIKEMQNDIANQAMDVYRSFQE